VRADIFVVEDLLVPSAFPSTGNA